MHCGAAQDSVEYESPSPRLYLQLLSGSSNSIHLGLLMLRSLANVRISPSIFQKENRRNYISVTGPLEFQQKITRTVSNNSAENHLMHLKKELYKDRKNHASLFNPTEWAQYSYPVSYWVT